MTPSFCSVPATTCCATPSGMPRRERRSRSSSRPTMTAPRFRSGTRVPACRRTPCPRSSRPFYRVETDRGRIERRSRPGPGDRQPGRRASPGPDHGQERQPRAPGRDRAADGAVSPVPEQGADSAGSQGPLCWRYLGRAGRLVSTVRRFPAMSSQAKNLKFWRPSRPGLPS